MNTLLKHRRAVRFMTYIAAKGFAAGFVFLAFLLYLFAAGDFNLYKTMEAAASLRLWLIFYGYGTACSVLIDILTAKVPGHRTKLAVLLYIAAGYAYFIVLAGEVNMFVFIAGTVGAICSLVFYGAASFMRNKPVHSGVFSVMLLLALLYLTNADFTVKKQWSESMTASRYKAKFAYFNGKHEIPVDAAKGRKIIFHIDWSNENGGGTGFHALDERDKLVGMSKQEGDVMEIDVRETGRYRIVVTGDRVKGSFTVQWKVY